MCLFPSTLIPLVDESTALNHLRRCVRGMTGKQKVVPWLNPPGESHKDGPCRGSKAVSFDIHHLHSGIVFEPRRSREDSRVTSKRRAHNTTDHFRILRDIGDGGKRQTPVGNLQRDQVRRRRKRSRRSSLLVPRNGYLAEDRGNQPVDH